MKSKYLTVAAMMQTKRKFIGMLVGFLAVCSAVQAQSPEIPVKVTGRQVVQSVALPASTSLWDYGSKAPISGAGEPAPLDMSRTDTVQYLIYLPLDYAEQSAKGGAPLLLYLHGANGWSHPEQIKSYGVPRYLDDAQFQKHWHCVTVSPLCKPNYCWSPAQLMLLLDYIEKHYTIDRKRVYVSGVSMGGFGTWLCLQQSPKRFAAAAPVCGGAKPEWAKKLTKITIWNFHGSKDPTVPVFYSDKMVEAIRNAGGNKVIYTVYDGADHSIWNRTYENQLLYDWLFSQKLQ
jgi:predicted peptidase